MKKTPLMISLLIGGVNLCSNSMGATFNVDGHPGLGSYTGYGTCQGCHEDEFDQHANNIMTTTHWTWNVDDGSPTNVGKINVINNYCVAVASNEPRCTSCHIGIGWNHSTDIRDDITKIDCLVCHDGTGTYQKNPTGAGAPFATLGGDPNAAPIDYQAIMRSFQSPDRDNCGACHFYGGGGEGVKHGSMDSSLSMPADIIDVHMGSDDQAGSPGMTCISCHKGNAHAHDIVGTRYSQANNDAAMCKSCHSSLTQHSAHSMPSHSSKLSCQACHVPSYAAGGKATKTYWDWETAGNRNTDGSDRVILNGDGDIVYHSKKGTFVWGYDVVPEYEWSNGGVTHITVADTVDPDVRNHINVLEGGEGNGLIFPVKKFLARQPFDTVNKNLVVPHLFPTPAEKADPANSKAFWMKYDWEKAAEAGMAAYGSSFDPVTSDIGFVETDFTWIQSHGVKPKEQAVKCWECHKSSDRINKTSLGVLDEQTEEYRVTYAGYRIMYDKFVNIGFYGEVPAADSIQIIDTGAYMGYLEVSRAPWVYSYNMAKYLYIPEEGAGLFGNWTYMVK